MKVSGDLLGQMGVDVGGDDTAMAEDVFDGAEVLAVFQQISSVRVSQGMNGGLFVDAAFPQSLPEGDLQGVDSYVTFFVGVEKYRSLAIFPVVHPKQLFGMLMQRHIA